MQTRRLGITLKLAAIVIAFAAGMGVLLAVVSLSLHIAGGVRAYVEGEGLWSKGQKDAVEYLLQYAHSRDERDYREYLRSIALPLGDHQARLELVKRDYSYQVAVDGFIRGGNAPEDVPAMIFLFRYFHDLSYLKRAIAIWTLADDQIAALQACAESLHALIQARALTPEKADRLFEQIQEINGAATPLEEDFSRTLGDGARWIERVLTWLILGSAALLLALGLYVSWRISTGIRAGIFRLREGAQRVAGGDLAQHIEVRSGDELEELADVFNEMIDRRRATEAELAAHAADLQRSNEELERFAFIASHDLQEPLRSITGYVQLLARRYGGKGDSADEFVGFILEATTRMRDMIQGILDYSRLGRAGEATAAVSLETLLDDALANLRGAIQASGARVTRDPLPTLPVVAPQIVQLFQNLVGNAIKFRGAAAPEVHVTARRESGEWRFCVSDNGIGIDPRYFGQMFQMFKRLHTRDQYPGSGLGLASCKRIVERHGGRIWVEEAPRGARFCFSLPAL